MRIEIEIIDIINNGHGVGKYDGMTVFVSGGKERPVVGDVVIAETVENKKSFLTAELKEVTRPSALRGVPFCRHAGECGGCALQNMTYEAQLALKEKQVRDKYTRIAGLENPAIKTIVGMDNPFRYRNKARIAVSEGGAGFFSAKSHTVVDCDTCLINSKPVDAVAGVLRESGRGLIHGALVRTAFATGEVMVVLDSESEKLPGRRKITRMIERAIDEIGDGGFLLKSTGGSTILDGLGSLKFEVSPLSFYQVNPSQAELLYNEVQKYAGLTGGETVLDVYCGAGALGLWCASKAGKVIGIEVSGDAVADANRNAVINGVVNAEFIRGKAETELPGLVSDGLSADVVILDPPRAGCKREVLEAAAATGAGRIIYVSCDAATQARDIKIFQGLGYRFIEAAPFDMFPWSLHTESCCLLMNQELQ